MAKTISVSVDDRLMDSAESLFESLGLDTSAAIRLFLAAAIETGEIPFPVMREYDRDNAIREAIARRTAGERFYTANEFLTNMKTAIRDSIGLK